MKMQGYVVCSTMYYAICRYIYICIYVYLSIKSFMHNLSVTL